MSKNIMFTTPNSKTPDVANALESLKRAYDGGSLEMIEGAVKTAKDTIAEKNRLSRKTFYEGLLNDENPCKAIVKAGYIAQDKLINRLDKDGNRVIKIDKTEVQVDISEVNSLTRTDTFSDDADYFARKLRNALTSYVASSIGKTEEQIEHAIGYQNVQYAHSNKTSMKSLKTLLQKTIDSIVYIDNDGKNLLLAKKEQVQQLSYWLTTKQSRYKTKITTTEFIRNAVVDIIWAMLNDIKMECIVEKTTF